MQAQAQQQNQVNQVNVKQEQQQMTKWDDSIPHIYYDYDPSNFHYLAPKPNKKQGKTAGIRVNSRSSQSMRIQLCRDDENVPDELIDGIREVPLVAPFGLAELKAGMVASDPTRKSIDVSIENPRLLEFLRAWDRQNIAMAAKNINTWFKGKEVTPDLLRFLYKPLVKLPKQQELKPGEVAKNYAPTMRLKVVTEGKQMTKVVWKVDEDKDGNIITAPGSIEDLKKKFNHMIPQVDCIGIWFGDQSWGCSLQMTEVMLVPPRTRPQNVWHAQRVKHDPTRSKPMDVEPNTQQQQGQQQQGQQQIPGKPPAPGQAAPSNNGSVNATANPNTIFGAPANLNSNSNQNAAAPSSNGSKGTNAVNVSTAAASGNRTPQHVQQQQHQQMSPNSNGSVPSNPYSGDTGNGSMEE